MLTWIKHDFYESTSLVSHGGPLVLQNVPFNPDNTRCDFCEMTLDELNPCTDIGSSPIDVYGCES